MYDAVAGLIAMTNKKDRKKDGNNYFYTLSDMLIWDKPEEGTTYIDRQSDSRSYERDISNDTVYIDRFLKTGRGVWEGVRYIEDFVDIDALKEVMRKYGLALPRYIYFMEPNIIYKLLGASGWTSSISEDAININIELVRDRNELLIVQSIAHESWHLQKQPKLIRFFAGQESKVLDIGVNVMNEYLSLVCDKQFTVFLKKRRTKRK